MATVVGLFDNAASAQRVVSALRDSGISASDISIAVKQNAADNTSEIVNEPAGSGGGGVASGAVLGGTLGAIGGLLVGIGALTIPGIGPVAVAGPLGTALTTTLVGAGIGAAAGGLVGALVDAGVPEEEAQLYSTGVERGGVLITARVPDGQEANAQGIMNQHGARDIRQDAALYNDPNYRYGGPAGGNTGSGATPTQ